MKHTLIKIVAIMLLGAVAQAAGGITRPGIYCTSEDAIRQILGSDKRVSEYLLRVGQCRPLGRHEYSEITTGAGDAISKGFWGIAQIILWLPTGPVEVWVPMEALGY